MARAGRALAESAHTQELEELLITMAHDECLDLYNRMEMIFMLIFYNDSLQNKRARELNQDQIQEAIAALPAGMSKRYESLMNE